MFEVGLRATIVRLQKELVDEDLSDDERESELRNEKKRARLLQANTSPYQNFIQLRLVNLRSLSKRGVKSKTRNLEPCT